jgi:hypothetical protein
MEFIMSLEMLRAVAVDGREVILFRQPLGLWMVKVVGLTEAHFNDYETARDFFITVLS